MLNNNKQTRMPKTQSSQSGQSSKQGGQTRIKHPNPTNVGKNNGKR